MIITGTAEQIAADIAATRRLGAAELIFHAQFSPSVGSIDDLVASMEELCALAARSA